MVFLYPGKSVPTSSTFSPDVVRPFYQWESNDGYCGEVSLLMAGMSNGQWMSQYNSRLVCGAFWGTESNGQGLSLLQAGNPLTNKINYNAQVAIESPNMGVSGPYDFAHASLCAANAGLRARSYPYDSGANIGMAGFQNYLLWIKTEVMAGHQVMIGTLLHTGKDAQYDHEVSVMAIGTRFPNDSTTFHPDDILYFDDHGVFTLSSSNGHWSFATTPSVPPGAGNDTKGCTPYVYSYTFGSLARTRTDANANGAPTYSIVIPGTGSIVTGAGNTAANGLGTVPIQGPHNYALSIVGPLDDNAETLPVTVTITGSTTNGVANPRDPVAGYDYETPYIGGPIGTCDKKRMCVSNTQPAPMQMALTVTVSGLTAGVPYNLYEYDFPTLTGAKTGTATALAIPTSDFNGNASKATSRTSFTATGSTYTLALTRTSDQIVVFRAVRQ
jgi:hypothetical protein